MRGLVLGGDFRRGRNQGVVVFVLIKFLVVGTSRMAPQNDPPWNKHVLSPRAEEDR